MFSIEAYWHWNKQRYLPWRLKVQGTHTVSSRCPVQLDITFTKINTIYSNATRHTAKSTSISDLWYVTSQGYNQLKFQHLFHLLLLNAMRWIVHLRIQSPKQLEFISHSHLANHAAYHMLRFVNTIHKPLLVYVCISIPDTSRAVINFGLILFMLTFLICIRGDGKQLPLPNSTISQ